MGTQAHPVGVDVEFHRPHCTGACQKSGQVGDVESGSTRIDEGAIGVTPRPEPDVRLVAQGGSPLGGVGGAQPGNTLAVVHQQVEVLPHGHDGGRRGAVEAPLPVCRGAVVVDDEGARPCRRGRLVSPSVK